MHIRSAASEDLDALVVLLSELHDPPDARADPSVWRAVLAQAGRRVLLAEEDGVVVGAADLLIVPNLTRQARPWMQVENVVVASARRREGIGTALMARAGEHAREAGCYKIQLMSAMRRGDAHRFYAALGFEPKAEGLRRYL